MTKTKDTHDPEGITTHIKQLDPQIAEVVELIRSIILEACRKNMLLWIYG
jgi:hypothetical protein